MSRTEARSDNPTGSPRTATTDMKLEVIVIPVSDVDRSKSFYVGLGWRLDADVARGDGFRVVQMTPPGSGCSIILGRAVTSAAPGSAQGLHLIVSDIEAARAGLIERGADSAADLSKALQRAAAAHGKHEERIGKPDPDWPDWYAEYMVREEAGAELPS